MDPYFEYGIHARCGAVCCRSYACRGPPCVPPSLEYPLWFLSSVRSELPNHYLCIRVWSRALVVGRRNQSLSEETSQYHRPSSKHIWTNTTLTMMVHEPAVHRDEKRIAKVTSLEERGLAVRNQNPIYSLTSNKALKPVAVNFSQSFPISLSVCGPSLDTSQMRRGRQKSQV